MSMFNGVSELCSECGDEFPEIDEATELCDGCYERLFEALRSTASGEMGTEDERPASGGSGR